MQIAARVPWTTFAVSLSQQLHAGCPCARARVPACRARHSAFSAYPRIMQEGPSSKRQCCVTAAASDVQADTAEVLEDTPAEGTIQQSRHPAESLSPDKSMRKRKALPVPQLVTPGGSYDASDIWSCAALLVDKPQTWTSFDVCGKLKSVLSIKKIGHAGTLDPMATGLLIICTGKATKCIDSFQAMHKEYSGTLKLGEATASYDADTEVTQRLPWQHLTLQQLQEQATTSFTGDLNQVPPMYSALRVKGKRLYESARKGQVIERAARPVHVSRFELTQDEADPQKVHFYVACSKGTYIRSLAHDLGQAVGSAAHLIALRREAIGSYSVKDAWTVDQLQAAFGKVRQNGHGNTMPSEAEQPHSSGSASKAKAADQQNNQPSADLAASP